MKELAKGFCDYVKDSPEEVFYSFLLLVIMYAAINLVVVVHLRLKKWYAMTRIKTSCQDFETVLDYKRQHRTKKGLNFIQRFLLRQTGSVISAKDAFNYVLSLIAVLFIIYCLASFTDSIILDKIMKGAILVCLVGSIWLLVSACKKLLTEARVLLFLGSLALFGVLAVDFYLYFIIT